MAGRRAAFWLAVGGVSILANLAAEIAADKTKSPGLRRLVGYLHRGPGGA